MKSRYCAQQAFTIIESLAMLTALIFLFWITFSLWNSKKFFGSQSPSEPEAVPIPSASSEVQPARS